MYATENAIVTRRISIFAIKLLISLAVVSKLNVVLLPSVFSVESIHYFVHSRIECTKQPHRDLPITKRYSVKFAFLIHPKTSLIVNIFIRFHIYSSHHL